MELSISILALGSTYALLAAGIVIIYKASRVINFAHGELAIVGAYVFHSAGFLTGATLTGPSLSVATAIAAVGSALFGVLIYFSLMRRLLGRPTFVAAMVTIGLAIILKAAIVVIWKSRSVGIADRPPTAFHFAGGGRIAWIELVSILICIALFAALAVFFQYTRLGRQFRGAAENPLLAAQRQVNINLILALAWALAVFSGGARRRSVRFALDAQPAKHDHRPERAHRGTGRRTRQPARRRDRRHPGRRGDLSDGAADQPDAGGDRAVSDPARRDELAAVGAVRDR